MISLLAFLFILGLLIVVHEFGHFIAAKKVGVRVEKFSLGFGAKIFSKKVKDTEYSISAVPLGGYVKLAGDNLEEYKGGEDEYLAKTPFQRGLIIFFGPLFNYVLGILFFWFILFTGYPVPGTRVGGVIDDLGAKKAGVQVGDRIIAVDGKGVRHWEEVQQLIRAKKAQESVALSILRDKAEIAITVKIEERKLEDLLGEKRSVVLLGIVPDLEDTVRLRFGFGRSFVLSIKKTVDLTLLTYKALFRMLSGRMSVRESVTGPLGIFYITSKATSVGIFALVHLVAVLSISLAIFNLFPLPALDGGHLILLALEKVRGKGLSLKAERVVVQAGLAFIIALAILVTYNDLLRFFGDKITQLLNR